jgi:tetratricopeptide (TPR) repeat protein
MARQLAAVLRNDSNNALAHSRLAELRLRQFELAQRTAKNDMSLAQIRDAALASNFETIKAQNEWLNIAIPENKKLLDQALHHAKRAVSLSPLQGEAYIQLAQLGFLTGDGIRAKRAYLAQALRVRPYDGDVLMAVGFELALVGRSEVAADYFKRVFCHADRYRDQIITVFGPRMPAEAFVQLFEPNLAATEKLFACYRKWGLATHAEVAGRRYLACLQQQPEEAEASMTADQWYQVFVVRDYLGDVDGAMRCLEQAVALEPRDFPKRRKLGRQLLKHQQYARAQQHLRWCVDRMPADPSLQRDLRMSMQASDGSMRR